jgi:hypothetical protein
VPAKAIEFTTRGVPSNKRENGTATDDLPLSDSDIRDDYELSKSSRVAINGGADSSRNPRVGE